MGPRADTDTVAFQIGPVGRAILVALVLAGQAGLLVWAGTMSTEPADHRHPNVPQLLNDYDRYVGQRAEVGGTVVSTEPLVMGTAGPRFAIRGAEVSAEPGDRIHVFGVVRADYTIDAINAYAIPAWSRWYAWIISFAAGLWVLARVVRHWRLDRTEWALTPRPVDRTDGGDREAADA